jgi:transcription-repair coupling factor (superfamily II helicase)
LNRDTACSVLDEADIVYLADDEQMAAGLAAALKALLPDRVIIFLPSSDALPGDTPRPRPRISWRVFRRCA